MATGPFRSPKNCLLLSGTVRNTFTVWNSTKYHTKWAVNVFTAWQNTRMNKKVQSKTVGGNGLERTDVEDLSTPLEHMSAKSLNFWLYLLVCGINRHLANVQGKMALNILDKSHRR